MPNLLQLSGAQTTKQTRFASIYTGRWSSGLWTNRSPLRDANTTRLVEKFYGPAGDALIDGLNTEVTNRLTLARRPGNVLFSDTWDAVNLFYEFHAYHTLDPQVIPQEHIHIMVDTDPDLWSLVEGVRELIWFKSAGAGQTYMQSVGNSLYWGNSVDNKKWLHPIYEWAPLNDWRTATTPILSTYIEDTAGNLQQLIVQGVSGSTPPTWSNVIPQVGNDFQGGITVDGTAQWVNRGPTVENWGIVAPNGTITTSFAGGGVAWQPGTRYSKPGVIIDSNGNLQQVTTAGKSGDTAPTWNTTLSGTTTDGTVVWTMIQTAASLVWQAHTTYADGAYVVGSGNLFQGSQGNHVTVSEPITCWIWNFISGDNGRFSRTYPATGPAATSTAGNIYTIQSPGNSQPFIWFVTNGAGETTSEPVPFGSFPTNYSIAMYGSLNVPVAGQYTIGINHIDGMIFGVGGGATQVSGTLNDPFNHTVTAVNGYPVMMSNNIRFDDPVTDTCVVNFPTAGVYPIEIDSAYANNGAAGMQSSLFFNGQTPTPPPVESGSTEPIWPAWTSTYAPDYPTAYEGASHQITWKNLGPVGDFVWQADTTFTLPGRTIIDSNGNTEYPYRTGTSGTTQPTWATGLNQLTLDAPNLIWINQGPITTPPAGTLSTYNGGWQYAIALVNTLDQTVSNCGNLSVPTGNFIGQEGVVLPPAAGLPTDLSTIDPQADYVAIFRTTDGGATPFLITGYIEVGSPATQVAVPWTIKLSDYIQNGYTDTATDEQLNNLIAGPIAGENTPPGTGAINLAYHLNRIWYSIENFVWWTSGPDTPAGNGVNGSSPTNFAALPSKVVKLVPVAIGMLVFTVEGIWLIQGNGTATSPLQGAIPWMPTIGVLHYNAVAVDGSIIGLFTTEKQFLILDPSAGVVDAGFPIGNLLRKNNGLPGTSWNPATAYVTCHTEGEDHAFYLADGTNGWYRLMPTPSPEVGYTWSPFAYINQNQSPFVGAQCVQSVEVEPGIHKLLIGPASSGAILNRDIDVFSDNGVAYDSWATVGSAVLVQPGQLALVMFVATDSVKIGRPLELGVLMDEAYPYYKGPVEVLKAWEPDPVNILPASTSILGQRFYLDNLREKAAVCRHMQIQIRFGDTDTVQNELLSMTIFGGYIPEG